MGNGQAFCLSERLQALADMVTPGSSVADIGCDHGFLSIYLARQGISPRVIAADLRKGPLSRAEAHVEEQGLGQYIETRLSDGLTNVAAGEADTLVCAGMGGRLMRKILTQSREVAWGFRELILQPQSELEEFRIFLRTEGYRIVQENILCEDGKYYFLIKALPPCGAEGDDCAFGHLADKYGGLLLAERHPVLKSYLLFQEETYSRIAEQIRSQQTGNGRTEERLGEICAELEDIREALKFFT